MSLCFSVLAYKPAFLAMQAYMLTCCAAGFYLPRLAVSWLAIYSFFRTSAGLLREVVYACQKTAIKHVRNDIIMAIIHMINLSASLSAIELFM